MVVLFGPEGFEDGDNTFPNWTSYGGSVTPDVQQVVVHSGSWASIMALTTGADSFLRKTIAGSPATLYWRTYLRTSALPDAGNDFEVFGIYGNPAAWLSQILIVDYVDPTPKWIFKYYDSGTVAQNITTPIPAINTWYCVEQRVTIGAGTGVADVWIDGVEKGPWTNLTNDAYTIVGAYLHSYIVAVTGTLNVYFDDAVAADAYNGPLAESPAFGTFLTCLAK